MAQKDWLDVLQIIEIKDAGLFETFLDSEYTFLPNEIMHNPFDEHHSNFSAFELAKEKPGQWIPIYQIKDIPQYFLKKKVVPIRAGAAEFFFYKGEVFFNLNKINFKKIDTTDIHPIESYIPVTLKANFQRNENAYLNKAIALGYINHFVDDSKLKVFQHEIITKSYKRLLYGQFGKIKITKPLHFKTTQGNKVIHPGFQFEIDLVLENRDEIIIFEAKMGKKPFENFSLLQLYYPLIYLQSIIDVSKPIRTVFIDVITIENKEVYHLLEVRFDKNFFDAVKIVAACEYELER